MIKKLQNTTELCCLINKRYRCLHCDIDLCEQMHNHFYVSRNGFICNKRLAVMESRDRWRIDDLDSDDLEDLL